MGQIANRMLIEAIFKAKEKLKEKRKKKNENRKQSENDGKQKKQIVKIKGKMIVNKLWSRKEMFIMTPLYAISAVCFWVTAL